MQQAGGHQAVLLDEVIDLLAPGDRRVFVDCTIGLGGHAEALLAAGPPDAVLIGIDVDEDNLRRTRRRLAGCGGRVRLFQANFADLEAVLAGADVDRADLILADLGFSSNQMAEAERGLSLSADGPLDMRLDRRDPRTAADLVNGLGERELADLIYRYGQERYSRRIARAIVGARRAGRIERTVRLAEVVSGAIPAPARRRRRGVHPATRTFLALRVAVNDELGNLERLLEAIPNVLSPGGRAAVIAFNSQEDARVKRAWARLAETDAWRLLTRKPIGPSAAQVGRNPRSRSAKLRGIEHAAP